MMRVDTMKRIGLRFAIVTSLTVGLAFGATAVGYAQATSGLNHYEDIDGNHYLTGCVTDDLAEHLVAHAGFEYGSAGAPIIILCSNGYTQVGKQLGR